MSGLIKRKRLLLSVFLLVKVGTGYAQPVRDSAFLYKAFAEKGRLIYAARFSGHQPEKEWVAEIDPQEASLVYVRNRQLVLDTKGGVTVWLNQLLTGNIRIEYDRMVVLDSGINDRLSDLNQFWMATDPRRDRLFTRKGVLDSYDSLSLYYVGMGGNYNSTTRFRRYNGQGERTLLGEYTDSAHLLQPNRWYHVVSIVKGQEVSFWIDGKCYFGYNDHAVLRRGYFGLRSTKSRQYIREVKVYQLGK